MTLSGGAKLFQPGRLGDPVQVGVHRGKGDRPRADVDPGAGPAPAGDAHQAVAPGVLVLDHQPAPAVSLGVEKRQQTICDMAKFK